MTTEENGQPYLKGKFTGLFKQSNKKHNGNYVFSDIHWTYLRIDNCEKMEDFDAPSHKTGDYWYADIIRSKERSRLFRKTTDVFIPYGQDGFYSGDLKNVLIKNLKINHSKSYFLQKDWYEASGDIFFQLSLPPKIEKKESLQTINQFSGTNLITNPIIKNNPTVKITAKNITAQYDTTNKYSGVSVNDLATNITSFSQPLQTNASAGNWSKWLGKILTYLFYALVAYYLWTHFKFIFYIFLFIIVLTIIGQILGRFGFLRILGTLTVLAFIAYYLYANFKGIAPDSVDPVKTRSGQVKILPPKPEKTEDGKVSDMASEKEVNWYDFIDFSYTAKYKTSNAEFSNSVIQQEELKRSINDFSSSLEFYTRFYNGLYRMDDEKINQVAKIFSDSAANKNMDPLQTAEMVITFVQEIPYYLVHDDSCEKAVSEGNEFIRQYHQENKPCLPNISGGVQSPYEFLHNLKGDCDTRSLLGHAILSKLNIASSVWVSEIYGHSILGVAVPVGYGIHKDINGIKHYGVELTAKGFRLGMVAPEQARPENWNITLYN